MKPWEGFLLVFVGIVLGVTVGLTWGRALVEQRQAECARVKMVYTQFLDGKSYCVPVAE